MRPVLAPARCERCFRPVVWSASDKPFNPGGVMWRNVGTLHRHWCAEERRKRVGECRVRMKTYGDLCGRRIGHTGLHRSRWAMDNENAAKERTRGQKSTSETRFVEKIGPPSLTIGS